MKDFTLMRSIDIIFRLARGGWNTYPETTEASLKWLKLAYKKYHFIVIESAFKRWGIQL